MVYNATEVLEVRYSRTQLTALLQPLLAVFYGRHYQNVVIHALVRSTKRISSISKRSAQMLARMR
jgi:hypothetical protein